MALKMDLEKAYDRLEWDFVVWTLNAAGFPPRMVSVIKECISTSSLKILWNGGITEEFRPSRGIRQGDPLSPYLFVLYMELLAHAISSEVDKGNWRGIKLGTSGPLLSHLFYADDFFLFTEAKEDQVQVVQRVLEEFCSVSGAKVDNFFLQEYSQRPPEGNLQRIGVWFDI